MPEDNNRQGSRSGQTERKYTGVPRQVKKRRKNNPFINLLVIILIIALVIFLTLWITVLVTDVKEFSTIPELIGYILEQVTK
jgi:hypothetical protein